MREPDRPKSEDEKVARAACVDFLDRVYGKPTQPLAGDPDRPPVGGLIDAALLRDPAVVEAFVTVVEQGGVEVPEQRVSTEAIRLTRGVHAERPDEPEVAGLLASKGFARAVALGCDFVHLDSGYQRLAAHLQIVEGVLQIGQIPLEFAIEMN